MARYQTMFIVASVLGLALLLALISRSTYASKLSPLMVCRVRILLRRAAAAPSREVAMTYLRAARLVVDDDDQLYTLLPPELDWARLLNKTKA